MRPEEAAELLRAARAERRTLVRLTDSHPELDEQWGHAAQAVDRAARLAAGERVVGAKLGLTSAPKQQTMGVHQPIVGFLTDAMHDVDPATLAQPRVEPEIAFRLGADLSAELTLEQVGDVVDAVAPALEVLDSRWTGYRFRLADVLADNTSAAGFVVGEWVPLHDVPDLRDAEARWLVDGEVVATTTPAAILGDPLLAVVHLSRHLAEQGETLSAGSVVLAGAMTDAVPVEGRSRFEVEVAGLGGASLTVA
ncbi:MAG TPA: fumarylacetoacetate hydrolase family protein [Nocardioides sp.]